MDLNNLHICRLCLSIGNDHINIFNQTKSGLDIADVIRQHFQCEVSKWDIFPNAVCFDCWIKTESFHKFYQTVTSAREEFLKQYLGDGLKNEINSEEEKPLIEHLQLSKNEYINEDELVTGSDSLLNMKDEYTGIDLDQSEDIMHHLELNEKLELLKPLQIQDVSCVQKQQIIDQLFDMTCDQCDACFESLRNAQTHYKEEHDIPKGYIKCCQRKLCADKYVDDHILWHLNPEIFQCEICDVMFNNRRSLRSHKFRHKANELRKHICDICGKDFGLKDKLALHIKSRHTVKHSCDLCDKSFSSEKKLTFHVQIIHNPDFENEKHRKIKVAPVKRQKIIAKHFDMSCDVCDENMESLEEAQNHYLEKHNSTDGYVKCCSLKLKSETCITEHIAWHLNPLIFFCKVCSKDLKKKSALSKHMQRHIDLENETHTCKKCNKVFGTKWNLRDHMDSNHKGAGFYKKCQYCGKCFSNKNNLSAHIKIIHVPEMEAEQKAKEENETISKYFDMTCDICTAKLESLDQAKFHYKMEHNIEDGYLKCCGLTFKLLKLVRDHINWHLNPGIFKCVICGQDMKSRRALHAHRSNHKASQDRKYKCDICKKSFMEKANVKCHILNIHVPKLIKDTICEICNKSFRSEKHLAAHVQLIHNDRDSENKSLLVNCSTPLERERIMTEHFDMSCDECEIQLKSLKAAKTHYFTEHKIRIGYIKCCNMKLKDPWIVEDHIDWHLNPEAFKCKGCHTLFKDRSKLRVHMASHKAIESDKYACPMCSKTFVTIVSLNNHIQMGHPDFEQAIGNKSTAIGDISVAQTVNMCLAGKDNKAQAIPKDTELIIPEYFNMACDLCFANLESFGHAIEHYLHEHSIEGYIKCCDMKFDKRWKVRDHIALHSNPETFKCKVCQKTIKSKPALRNHLLTHRSKHNCNVCGRSFQGNAALKLHQTVHEKKESQFECKFCKKRFSREINLKSHVNRMHTPKNHRICDICAKVCKSETLLRAHLLTHSTSSAGPKDKVQCDICGSWLKNRYGLKTHMLIHTTGPQKCNQCDKVAQGLTALRSHIRTVHIDAIYKCHLCERAFKLAPALKDHVATHTGEKQYKCSYCPDSFTWKTNKYNHQKKAHPEEWSKDKIKKNQLKKMS